MSEILVLLVKLLDFSFKVTQILVIFFALFFVLFHNLAQPRSLSFIRIHFRFQLMYLFDETLLFFA